MIKVATLPLSILKSGKLAKGADPLTDAAPANKVTNAADAAADVNKAADAGDAAKAPEPQGPQVEGNGGQIKPRKTKKKPNKPRQPREYVKKVENADGSVTYTQKTANGELVDVTYKDGYPDFSPHRYDGSLGKSEVDINMTGNNNTDFKRANSKAGFGDSAYSHPDGYIWHHHENQKTMQLIKADVHNAFPHTGGASGARHSGASH